MRYFVQKIIFIFSVIISLFVPVTVFAEEAEDVYISVSADKDTSRDVESGDDIVFTIRVKNTSEEDKLVKLKCNQNKWSKEIDISSGDIKDIRMTYTVPDDIEGGESIKFQFSGICDGRDVMEDGDTYFSFHVEEIEDLRFKVQLEQDGEFSVGDNLDFEVLIENRGNTDVDSIKIEHSLGDEKVEINSLAPGEEKTISIKYQIPNTIRLNEVVTDSFYLKADGISEMVKDITFFVLGEAELELYLYTTPDVYSVDDTVSVNLSVKNVGSTLCENLIITNSKDTNWQERIDYLAESGTTKSEFSFTASQEESISFYIKDQDGKLISEQSIQVYSTRKETNPPGDTSDIIVADTSLTPITDSNFISGGGSIDLSVGGMDDNWNDEIDSVLTQEVESQEFNNNMINTSVNDNNTINNSTSSTSNNIVMDNSTSVNESQIVSSENEVDLPKTGYFTFSRFGVLLFLILGIVYIKFKYLHT